MRISRFYLKLDAPLKPGVRVTFPKDTCHYITRVLRLKSETVIQLFDGLGNEYSATLLIEKKTASALINKVLSLHTESHLNITLLQGLSTGQRMDYVIQKSTELGVSQIVPVITFRSMKNYDVKKQQKKHAHWKNIIINTCEQCGRNKLPTLQNIQPLEQALQTYLADLSIVFDIDESTSFKSLTQAENIRLLIGPEGGLSAEDFAQAKQHRFIASTLGPRILRTETAPVAAITALQLLWGDMS
ncbi:MAG: 16S rRNA (uracil(1498)-N(3))-methyltransferase [Gammaproteobacteria bacterium]|nr:16S rRNA (uracil(1498)-N(3))-methyltransferase [Gammaproteobacteria bacterium]